MISDFMQGHEQGRRILSLGSNVVNHVRIVHIVRRRGVAEEEEAETLLMKWKQMHYVRLCLGALGYIGTLAAYVTTV